MKNLTTVLIAVLIVAVGGLYYIQFSSTEDVQNQETESTGIQGELTIAYVNSDTLLNNYNFFAELTSQLDGKRVSFEKELENRATGLQKQFEDYQRTAQNMTMAQARAVEEDLTTKRNNLQQYQQSLTQELMGEEARITRELYDKVAEYLKRYSEKHNIHVVLTYTPGSGVLYADKALDITQDVIDGLNDEYENGPMGSAADSTSVK